MFAWLKQRLARRRAEQRGREIFSAAQGSYVERCAIVALLTAIEAEDIGKQREKMSRDSQMIFMIAYECCMMWAIKSGMETALKPQEVRSAVLAMQRHLASHAWYQAGPFEKIWAKMQVLMPRAMIRTPDAPMVYPAAEMLMAANEAGYPLDLMIASDLEFGIKVLLMIQQLHKTFTDMKV